jgi:hypothetical protein
MSSLLAISNTENISRWYPITPAQLQTANNIVASVRVADEFGAIVKNHPIRLRIERRIGDPAATQEPIYFSNVEGWMSPTRALNPAGGTLLLQTNYSAACSGTVESAGPYGPPSVPGDKWNGTAQRGRITATVLGSGAVAPATTIVQLPFLRICSETYLGIF